MVRVRADDGRGDIRRALAARPSRSAQRQDSENQGSEVAVYKDQLAEIERDLASGLIAAPEAEAARVEISRRLLAAAGNAPVSEPKSNLKWRRAAAVLALVGLPLIAIGVYIPLGSPETSGLPAGATGARVGARHGAVARESRRAGRATSGKESDRRSRLERARPGAGAAGPLRRRGARLSQCADLQRREPGAPVRSRRGDRGRRQRCGDGGSQDRVRACACAQRRRSQGELLPGARRRAGRPQG